MVTWLPLRRVNQHIFHGGALRQRLIHGFLELYFSTSPKSPVLRDNRRCSAIVDAIDQCLRGKSAEHNGVRRSDARARQHRDRQLGHHAHVDGDTIAFANAQRLQHVRALGDLAQQLLIGEGSRIARLAFPQDGGFVLAPGGDVAVQAVVGNVQLAPDEPFGEGQLPFEHAVPRLEPVQFARDLGPETFRVFGGLLIQAIVVGPAPDLGPGAELVGRFKNAPFV
jgi:hypothetical protein